MGNQHRDEGRRADDRTEPLSPAHRLIYDRIGQVAQELEGHMDSPIHIPDPNDYAELIKTTSRIVDALEGPEYRTLDGHTARRETDGVLSITRHNSRGIRDLTSQVTQVEARLETGIQARLSPRERVAILVAAVGGSFALVGTIVDAIIRTPH